VLHIQIYTYKVHVMHVTSRVKCVRITFKPILHYITKNYQYSLSTQPGARQRQKWIIFCVGHGMWTGNGKMGRSRGCIQYVSLQSQSHYFSYKCSYFAENYSVCGLGLWPTLNASPIFDAELHRGGICSLCAV